MLEYIQYAVCVGKDKVLCSEDCGSVVTEQLTDGAMILCDCR